VLFTNSTLNDNYFETLDPKKMINYTSGVNWELVALSSSGYEIKHQQVLRVGVKITIRSIFTEKTGRQSSKSPIA
jgi:hypothetical protein